MAAACHPLVSISPSKQKLYFYPFQSDFYKPLQNLRFGEQSVRGWSLSGKGRSGKLRKWNVFNEEDSGDLEESDNSADEKLFVKWFREAWPYLWAHRERTFVVIISGEIVSSPFLDPILKA